MIEMKDVRFAALNWSLVALLVTTVLYSVFWYFDSVPPVTTGSYELPIVQDGDSFLKVAVPNVAGEWWLMIVPILAFAVRYFIGWIKHPIERHVQITGGVLITCVWVTIWAISIREFSGPIGPATVAVIGFVLIKEVGTSSLIAAGLAAFDLLILGIQSPYKIEALVALPGYFAGYFALSFAAISSFVLLATAVEKVVERETWTPVFRIVERMLAGLHIEDRSPM